MAATAKLRYLRIAPRKVRLVSDLVRGKSVLEAQTLLQFTTKRSALPILKLLKQAIANMKQSSQADEGNLYISKITVDEGPKLKRYLPRARGRVSEIQKKTSHVTLVLEEITKKPKKKKRGKKAEKLEKAKIPKKDVRIPREKPRFRPELILPRPKEKGEIKRVFRRKAF